MKKLDKDYLLEQSVKRARSFPEPQIKTYEVDVFRTVNQHRIYKVASSTPEDAVLQAEQRAACDIFNDETPFISIIIQKENHGSNS